MSEAIRYEKDSDNIVVLTMDAPGQSANTMNETYKTSMDECIDRLEKEENLAGVVLTSAKKTFFAGGDLNELVKATPEVAQEFMDGVVCVAVPVTLGNGNCVGAIAMSSPEARMDLKAALEFVPLMRQTVRQLAQSIEPDNGRHQPPM